MTRSFRSGVLTLVLVALLAACSGAPQPSAARPGSQTAAAAIASPTAEQQAQTAATPPPGATSETPTAAEEAQPVPPQAPEAPRSADGAPLYPFLPANGRPRVVVLDPGHGGPEVGAASVQVREKDLNLLIARRLRALLEQDGMRVAMVRDCDCRAVPPAGFEPPATWNDARKDLQARLDIANLAGGDVYISIHNNGSGDSTQKGSEVWWDGRRPFAAYNRALAGLVLEELVSGIRAAGYPAVNRGLQEDSNYRVFQGRTFPIFVLGPPRTGVAVTRAARMPAALGESLFLSNVSEAPYLAREDIQNAIAAGYARAITRYFALVDGGALALPSGGLPPEIANYYDTPGPPQPSNPGQSPGR